jgi:hypothetical protein
MPLERSYAVSDLSNPDIVLGPRKRRPTERLLENGDPLVCKKKKVVHALSSMPPPAHPTDTAPNPGQTTGRTESGDDRASNGTQVITVDSEEGDEEGGDEEEGGSDKEASTDEDDDAELGACSVLQYLG